MQPNSKILIEKEILHAEITDNQRFRNRKPKCSIERFAHLHLLLCMYDFSYIMFFDVYVCFPCLVFVPGLHSLDYRITLVLLITLCTRTSPLNLPLLLIISLSFLILDLAYNLYE